HRPWSVRRSLPRCATGARPEATGTSASARPFVLQRWRMFLETPGAPLRARPEVAAPPLPRVLQRERPVPRWRETCRRDHPLRQQTEIAASSCRAHDARCLWRAQRPAADRVEADRFSPQEAALLSSSTATEVLLGARELPSPSAAPADSGLLRPA